MSSPEQEPEDEPFGSIGGTHEERRSQAQDGSAEQMLKIGGAVAFFLGVFMLLIGLISLSIGVIILALFIALGGAAVYDGRLVTLIQNKLEKK